MKRLGISLAVVLTAGCATFEPVPVTPSGVDAATFNDCVHWYRDLDARIDAGGVRDAQEARVAGFPYLRVNRLLASFRAEAASDERAFDALVERMRSLDLAARQHEAANLPREAPGAREPAATLALLQRAEECAALMHKSVRADAQARAALLARASVPDDYSTASRVFGFYLLSQIPFSAGVRRHQEEVRAAYGRALAVPPDGTLKRYAPPAATLPRAAAAVFLERASNNPLRIPEPGTAELEQLYAAYAPVFEIEDTGEYDRIGALQWTDGPPPSVRSGPVAYRQAAWTRYRGQTLLQLVYTIWFPERPPMTGDDILAGKLDGVTWRVTIAPDGEPLLYDSMHPCGCFHMFYPTPRAQPAPAPEGEIEWMFSPQSLPRVAEGERPVVRVATRTHYVERVGLARDAGAAARYEFRPYDELRSLPRPDGSRASAFGSDGLIAGSERPERFLFWPMGIDSAGTMRQWGRHATAFVGRQHFDDADLIERRFVLDLAGPVPD